MGDSKTAASLSMSDLDMTHRCKHNEIPLPPFATTGPSSPEPRRNGIAKQLFGDENVTGELLGRIDEEHRAARARMWAELETIQSLLADDASYDSIVEMLLKKKVKGSKISKFEAEHEALKRKVQELQQSWE